jgi:hypothetical protein
MYGATFRSRLFFESILSAWRRRNLEASGESSTSRVLDRTSRPTSACIEGRPILSARWIAMDGSNCHAVRTAATQLGFKLHENLRNLPLRSTYICHSALGRSCMVRSALRIVSRV